MRALILTLLLLPATLFAADPRYREAVEDYRLAVAGDQAAGKRALGAFGELSAAAPADPLRLAYLGASETLRARDAWMPWTKMSMADSGLAKLDRALALLGPEHERIPDGGLTVSLRVRSLAGATFIRMPGLFGRFDQGRELLQGLLKDPRLAQAPGEASAYIRYFAAEAAREDGDLAQARAEYRAAAAADPDGEYGRHARTALTALR